MEDSAMKHAIQGVSLEAERLVEWLNDSGPFNEAFNERRLARTQEAGRLASLRCLPPPYPPQREVCHKAAVLGPLGEGRGGARVIVTAG